MFVVLSFILVVLVGGGCVLLFAQKEADSGFFSWLMGDDSQVEHPEEEEEEEKEKLPRTSGSGIAFSPSDPNISRKERQNRLAAQIGADTMATPVYVSDKVVEVRGIRPHEVPLSVPSAADNAIPRTDVPPMSTVQNPVVNPQNLKNQHDLIHQQSLKHKTQNLRNRETAPGARQVQPVRKVQHNSAQHVQLQHSQAQAQQSSQQQPQQQQPQSQQRTQTVPASIPPAAIPPAASRRRNSADNRSANVGTGSVRAVQPSAVRNSGNVSPDVSAVVSASNPFKTDAAAPNQNISNLVPASVPPAVKPVRAKTVKKAGQALNQTANGLTNNSIDGSTDGRPAVIKPANNGSAGNNSRQSVSSAAPPAVSSAAPEESAEFKVPAFTDIMKRQK